MILLIICIIFYILHLQFLFEVVFWGRTDFSFFGWESDYLYSKNIALKALIFSTTCLISFLIGYLLTKRKKQLDIKHTDSSKLGKKSILFDITILFYSLFIFSSIIIVCKDNFIYEEIVKSREKFNFLFELRTIPLITTSYILLNSSPKDWKTPKFKRLKLVLIIYLLTITLIQARSLIFEFGLLFLYYFLRLNNNKFKPIYILYFYLISLIPNIFLIYRIYGDFLSYFETEKIKNIFTYEYSLLFNNILSEIIESAQEYSTEYWKESLLIIIPSPIRQALNIYTNSHALDDIAHNAGVLGGGFSLLGELYLNFKYFTIVFFIIIGSILSKINNGALYNRNVSFHNSIAPLFFSYLILAFRNGLSVFIKQTFTIFLISFIIYIIKKGNNNKKNRIKTI